MVGTDWSVERKLLGVKGASIEPGLTHAELSAAEAAHGFQFPNDLRSLLAAFLPRGGGFPDWRDPESADLHRQMDGPFAGIQFDIEHCNFWWPSWGSKPAQLSEAFAIARDQLKKAPRLIPISGHRYMPSSPQEPGNPVYSVVQTDIIYYGSDLRSYLHCEFGRAEWEEAVSGEVRHIEFWTDLIDSDL